MNPSFRRLFDIYVLAYVFLLASKPLNDPDLWFHLKTGQYIVLNGVIPRSDPFSFTNYGRPWIAHGWLSGLIFYLIQSRFGFGALIFLFAVLVTFGFWLTYRQCHAYPFVAGIAVLLGVLSVATNIGVRPRVFTFLLTSVFLFILGNYSKRGTGKLIWILIPLIVLWVNLHGGFFIGLALIALTMVGTVLDKWLGDDEYALWLRLKVLSFVLVGCLVAILLNPYGAAMYVAPIRVLQSAVYKEVIVDWLSPDFHRPEVFPFLLLLLLTTTALAVSPVRAKPSELLLFLATLFATLTSQRNVLVFVLVAVPLFANYFQHWLDSNALGRVFNRNSLFSGKANVLAVVLLLPLILFAVKLKLTVYGKWRQQTMDVPLKAVEFLKERQIVGNTFTDPNIWANYLIWAMPSNSVYIDGRDVYPEQFVKEYVDIVLGTRDWREAFDYYRVEVAIVAPKSVLARKIKAASGWREIYEDEMALVFLRLSDQ